VLEGENTKVVGKNPVIDGVKESEASGMPDICLAGAPTLGSLLYHLDGAVGCFEELSAESRNATFVELSRSTSSASASGW